MKSVCKLFSLVLLLANCGGKSYTVEVQNLSAKRFDSVQVFINTGPPGQPAVNFGPLGPGQAIPPLELGEIFGGQYHKMRATAIFYAADTVIRNYGPYNGGMIMYKHYKVTINDSLQVKWDEWN